MVPLKSYFPCLLVSFHASKCDAITGAARGGCWHAPALQVAPSAHGGLHALTHSPAGEQTKQFPHSGLHLLTHQRCVSRSGSVGAGRRRQRDHGFHAIVHGAARARHACNRRGDRRLLEEADARRTVVIVEAFFLLHLTKSSRKLPAASSQSLCFCKHAHGIEQHATARVQDGLFPAQQHGGGHVFFERSRTLSLAPAAAVQRAATQIDRQRGVPLADGKDRVEDPGSPDRRRDGSRFFSRSTSTTAPFTRCAAKRSWVSSVPETCASTAKVCSDRRCSHQGSFATSVYNASWSGQAKSQSGQGTRLASRDHSTAR